MQKTLAPDVAYVLDTIRPYLITKGISLDHLGPVVFGLAMDARIQVRQRTTTPEQFEALADPRHVMQQTTQACLYPPCQAGR